MREQFEHTMAKVVDAVNGASDGAWIDESEGPVRDALAEFREAAYRQALQMRLDETQSSNGRDARRRELADAQLGGESRQGRAVPAEQGAGSCSFSAEKLVCCLRVGRHQQHLAAQVGEPLLGSLDATFIDR